MPDCIFAPYFPPEEPQKFANVHKIFGASNVSKLLNEVLPHQREDAVNSLAYEAEARIKDPVYGCVGAISVLQRQVIRLQKELDATNAEMIRYTSACAEITTNHHHDHHHDAAARLLLGGNEGPGGSSSLLAQSPSAFYYPSPWNNNDLSGGGDHVYHHLIHRGADNNHM